MSTGIQLFNHPNEPLLKSFSLNGILLDTVDLPNKYNILPVPGNQPQEGEEMHTDICPITGLMSEWPQDGCKWCYGDS